MLRCYLDNTLIPLEHHSVLSEASFTFELAQVDDFNNDNYGIEPWLKRNYSSDITFYSDTAIYIKNKLITNNINGDAIIILEIKDDCCSDVAQVLYRGKTYKKDISWCSVADSADIDCEVTMKSEEDTETSNAYDCVRQALIAKRDILIGGIRFDQMPHAFVRYCKEARPRFTQDIFYCLFFLLANFAIGLAIALKLVSVVIGFVAKVANILGLSGISNTLKDFEKGLDVFDDMVSNYISGCGKGNVAPTARHYIQNVCQQCGLQFNSSILNNPNSVYYDMVLFESSAELPGFDWWVNGAPLADINEDWYRLNAPNYNGAEFLNMLRKHMCVQWWIDGNKLYIEQVIPNANNLWIDFSVEAEKAKIVKLCWNGSDKSAPAGFRFTHTSDPAEMIGDEGQYLYNDLIDWKNPVNAYNGVIRTDIFGIREQITPFSPVRFKRDGITRDIMRFWNEFEMYRSRTAFGIYLTLITTIPRILSWINPFTSGYDNWKYNLLLQQGVARTPKLLVLEKLDPNASNIVKEGPYNIHATNDCYLYNSPMWFADQHDIYDENKPYRNPNLFNLWQIINPNRITGLKNIEFSLELLYNCEDVANLYNFIQSSNPKNIFIKLLLDGITYSSKPLNRITLNENTITIDGMI